MSDHDPDTGEVMLADARLEDFGDRMSGPQALAVAGSGMMMQKVGDLFGSVTTAQPVIAKRDVKALMQTLRVLAETFGDDYIYSWRVNDKNSKEGDGKTTIEGHTINLTNDLAREFGNNILDIREVEGPQHWVFYGRFTDLQTGSTLTRAFRQRKNALAGNYENDRKLDMAYQIGQSKCLRNVVVNALRSYADFMFKIAKGALVKKIQEDPEFYLERITKGLTMYKITLGAAEGVVGRPKKEWDARDIAKVFSALKAVAEGLADPREAFPDSAPVNVPNPEDDDQDDETTTESTEGAAATSGEAEPDGSTGSREAPSAPSGEAEKPPAKKAEKAPPRAKAEPAPSPAPAPAAAPKTAAKKPAALF